MAAISGFTSLILENTEIPNQLREQLDIVSRNCRHLEALTNDLVTLSKAENGQMESTQEWVSLTEEVKTLLETFGAEVGRKSLVLEANFLGFLPGKVFCRARALRQVLINIVGNAVKYTLKGSVLLSVRAHRTFDSRSLPTLKFTVTDTGIGIAEGFKKNLFQPFSRSTRREVLDQQGSGLGLALSRNLAHSLGGEIRLLESSLGRGSSFEFTMKVERPEETVWQKREATPSPISATIDRCESTEIKGTLNGVKVLVAEDSSDLQILLRTSLEMAGANVRICDNGAEAMQEALSGDYGVVLMDLKMPHLDGLEAVKELRSRGFRTPIIALTAHASLRDQEACYRIGFNDFLSKPCHPFTLIKTIRGYAAHNHSSVARTADQTPI
jgi:CheY-like chemotaxis protein